MSTSDAGMLHQTLQYEEAELKNKIEDLRAAPAAEQGQITRSIQQKITGAKRNLSVMKSEVRGMGAGTEKMKYERFVKEHEDALKALQTDFQQAKDGVKGASAALAVAPEGPEFSSAKEVLDQGIRIQNDDIRSLERAMQYGVNAGHVADATIIELREQMEKISEINEELNTLQGQLKRARKEFVVFVRSAMTDKCFICIFVLILLTVCALIAYELYKKIKG